MIKASLLNVAGRVVSIFSTFMSVFLLGRMFSPSDFGYWTWLFSIFSLITAQDFGFIGAMRVRMGFAIAAGNSDDQKLLFSVAFLLSVIFSVVLLAVAGVCASRSSLYNWNVLLVLCCALLTVMGYCAAQGSVAYLQSGWIGIAESLRGLLQIAVIVLASMLGLEFETTLLLFYIFSALYTPFVTLVFLRSREWGLIELIANVLKNFRNGTRIAMALLKDGAYLWMTQIGLAILTLSDVFIAGFLVSDDDVAVVNAIVRLILVAVGFVMAAMTPLAGHFVLKLSNIDENIVWKRFSIAAAILILLGGTYGFFLYYFGPDVIAVWANLIVAPSYVFVVAGLLFSVIAILTLLQTFLQMQIITKAMLPLLLVAGVLKLLLPFLIVPHVGYEGVFLSSLIVNVTFVVFASFLLFKRSYLKKVFFAHHAGV